MLSRNEKRILKLANKTDGHKVEYDVIEKTLKICSDDVHSACRSLISKDLVIEKFYSPSPTSWIPWGIVLSENGRHRFRHSLEKFSLFILKSILVPMVVSILTTLLTMFLSQFFK